MLAVLPPFHIYALTVNMLLGLRIGAELVLHTRFDVDAVVKDIANKKITSFPGVPTMYVAIINYPDIEKVDVSSLKWCASGGAPLPLEVQQRFQEITGCRLAEGWGMTETSPTGTFTPPNGPVKPGSCGIPIPGITIKFANVEDPSKYVPYGEKGEMAIGGPNVMKGYWKKPDATADVMTPDGYMRTGDVGYMDEDGYIYIVDRTKDMLLCGGFNVYPRIIEEAIYKHPSVEEVSVIGIRDEYRGQSPKAFIKLKAGAPAHHLRRDEKLPEGQARQARAARRDGNSRRIAKDRRRQIVEEGALRGGGAQAGGGLKLTLILRSAAGASRRTWQMFLPFAALRDASLRSAPQGEGYCFCPSSGFFPRNAFMFSSTRLRMTSNASRCDFAAISASSRIFANAVSKALRASSAPFFNAV